MKLLLYFGVYTTAFSNQGVFHDIFILYRFHTQIYGVVLCSIRNRNGKVLQRSCFFKILAVF